MFYTQSTLIGVDLQCGGVFLNHSKDVIIESRTEIVELNFYGTMPLVQAFEYTLTLIKTRCASRKYSVCIKNVYEELCQNFEPLKGMYRCSYSKNKQYTINHIQGIHTKKIMISIRSCVSSIDLLKHNQLT